MELLDSQQAVAVANPRPAPAQPGRAYVQRPGKANTRAVPH